MRNHWFAAHLVLYVKLREEPQDRVPVWENIILIKANTVEEAMEKAEQRGREDTEEDPSFRWGGKPAQWMFAGVRKVTSCEDPDRRPGDGTEISFTEMQVESEQAVLQFVNGDPVAVVYTERFADEVPKSVS